jgi:GNAT superfamily N-acetyltransferase
MREGARRAHLDDLPRLAELCRVAVAELTGRPGGALLAEQHGSSGPVEQQLARMLEDGEQSAWVGTIDDVVLGYATGRTETLSGGTNLGVVEALFVEPGARGVGVGEALLDALLDWFDDRGCAEVDTVALPGDRLTKNFLESSGFTARLIVMHRQCRPAPSEADP